MTAPTTERIHYGVRHSLERTDDGVLLKQNREPLSMTVSRDLLELTVVDGNGWENTVKLDAAQVAKLAEALPLFRQWMLHGDAALEDQ